MEKSSVEGHFNKIAGSYDFYKNKNKFYYDNLKHVLKSLIPEKKSVFEIGCGTGDLLVSIVPLNGYGMDLSSSMVILAKAKHKKFKNINFSTEWPKKKYGFIFMSDVIEHLEHPAGTFEKVSKLMDEKSFFICTMANPIWEPILLIGEWLGMKMPEGPHKRIGYTEIRKLVIAQGMKIVKHDYKLLVPVKIPILTNLANKYLERYLRKFAFIEYFVARKA